VCLLRGTDWLFTYNPRQSQSVNNLPWLRLLVAGLSRRRHGFDPKSVLRMTFVVEREVFGKLVSPVLLFSPLNVIPSCCYMLLCSEGRNVPKTILFRKSSKAVYDGTVSCSVRQETALSSKHTLQLSVQIL